MISMIPFAREAWLLLVEPPSNVSPLLFGCERRRFSSDAFMLPCAIGVKKSLCMQAEDSLTMETCKAIDGHDILGVYQL